ARATRETCRAEAMPRRRSSQQSRRARRRCRRTVSFSPFELGSTTTGRRRLRGDVVEQRAVLDGLSRTIRVAVSNEPGERYLESPKLSELVTNGLEVGSRDLARLAAWGLGRRGGEKLAHLFDGEAEVAAAPDEH